jgi:hypothetical protein
MGIFYINYMELSFEIDKITESIELVKTNEHFETIISLVKKQDLKVVTKKNGWKFDWKQELNQQQRLVYKLTTEKEPSLIQGLVSLEIREKDKFIFMHLIENAPFNIGKDKFYQGVCANLVAYGCKLSVEHGFEGFLAFDAKTALIEHYKKVLRAIHIGGQKMIIDNVSAFSLIAKYFSNKGES